MWHMYEILNVKYLINKNELSVGAVQIMKTLKIKMRNTLKLKNEDIKEKNKVIKKNKDDVRRFFTKNFFF